MKGSSAEHYYPAWLPVLTKIASAFVIALSCVVLLGWMFGIPQLIRVVPTMVSMNPLTALALILGGISLLRLGDSELQVIKPFSLRSVFARQDRLGVVLAGSVLVLGAVMLADAPYTILKGAVFIHPTLAEGFFGLMESVKEIN